MVGSILFKLFEGLIFCFVFWVGLAPSAAEDKTSSSSVSYVVGVTEPSEEIDLAFPEVGILAEIAVEEGDEVAAGELLARLDSRIYENREKIATLKAKSEAAIRSATATLEMREKRLEQLEELGLGRVSPDELARAKVDRESAKATLDLAMESAEQAKVELHAVLIQLDRRRLISPIAGVVTRIYRDVAESVAGVETRVVTVVNLESLVIVVHIDVGEFEGIKQGDVLRVESLATADEAERFEATVSFVSPVIDASSRTRRVKLALDNSDGRHISGGKYRVFLE